MAIVPDPGRGELRVERESIEVTSDLPRADKQWRYTDRAGHEHYWQDGYPTLHRVVDRTYWCADCRDEHTDSHLECPLCGETIVPGIRPAMPFREFVPGPAMYYLDDQPISEEQYRLLKEQRVKRRVVLRGAPGRWTLLIDGQDISGAVAADGFHVDFDDGTAHVMITLTKDVAVDLDLSDAEVDIRREPASQP